jgi:peptidoglycan/xylan/chitin deacetylase (PgdA/CDA1 family)
MTPVEFSGELSNVDKAIITTSWDDGHPLDLQLAELLQKYDIPATFYIPVDNIERECMSPQQINEIAQSFDVGGHSYHHVNLVKISPEEASKEIMGGKERLEEIIGRELFSFCYPKGRFNDEVISIVKGAGFIGGRTVKLFSRNLKDRFKMCTTATARNLWPTAYVKHTVVSADPSLFLFMLKSNLFFESWDRIATETLDFVIENGGVWHFWGHSWEIDDYNDWGKLEEVLRQTNALSKEALKVDNSQLIKLWRREQVAKETDGIYKE